MHRLRWFALAAILAAGCDHRPEDFRASRAAVTTFQSDWSTRLDAIEARNQELTARVQPLPPGTPDLDMILNGLNGVKAQVGYLRGVIETIGGDASTRIDNRQRRLADDVLRAGARQLGDEVKELTATLDKLGADVDRAVNNAAKEEAPPEVPPVASPAPVIADAAFARATGSADLTGIEFEPSTAELDLDQPSTVAALGQLLAFAGTCDELRFSITVHTAKDGSPDVNQKLSEARAHAIRRHLVEQGIPEARIVTPTGVGGTQPLVDEPEPGSPEEAAMSTEELAAIRARNRRVSIGVIAPCPAQA